MARRVARRAGDVGVSAVLENVAQRVWVAVSGGEVGDAESEGSLGVEVCATLEQRGKAIDVVVLGGVVDGGVAFVVSGVHNGEESARLEGEVVECANKRNDVCKQRSVSIAFRDFWVELPLTQVAVGTSCVQDVFTRLVLSQQEDISSVKTIGTLSLCQVVKSLTQLQGVAPLGVVSENG